MSPGHGVVDLRTDVVAGPTDEMWEAMRRARFGWSYVNEDPYIKELEALVAELLGKDDATFIPTAGAGNLAALMTSGERGTQAIVEATSHIMVSEAWNIAYVANLIPATVDCPRGQLTPEIVTSAVAKARSLGLPRTSLVCIENTHTRAGGTVMTPRQVADLTEASHRQGAAVHMDGARLFNAAAALGVSPSSLVEGVDTVVISLNKGLSAPYGAVLAGSRAVIAQARVNLKRLGAATVHKAGILAAAGIVALQTMVTRISEDNRRAADLGRRLGAISGLHLDTDPVESNIVLADVGGLGLTASEVSEQLEERGFRAWPRSATQIRFVTHRLIGDYEVAEAARAMADIASVAAVGARR